MPDISFQVSGAMLVMYAYCCMGSLVLWMRGTVKMKKAHSLQDVFDIAFPTSNRLSKILQFIFFVLFGGIISLIFVSPTTPQQAISAGIAWSRLVK